MKWFRFYSEALHDPKVQRLSGDLFKAWINILCLANEQSQRGSLPSLADIAWALRMPEEQAEEMLTRLASAGLLDGVGGDDFYPPDGYKVHGWEDRQRVSDDVTARVTKHRAERKEAVTLHETEVKRYGNALEQNRTDTDKTRTEERDTRARATLQAVPKTKRASKPETEAPEDIPITPELRAFHAEHSPDLDLAKEVVKFLSKARAKGWKYKDWEQAFENWLVNEDGYVAERKARNGADKPRNRHSTNAQAWAEVEDDLRRLQANTAQGGHSPRALSAGAWCPHVAASHAHSSC